MYPYSIVSSRDVPQRCWEWLSASPLVRYGAVRSMQFSQLTLYQTRSSKNLTDHIRFKNREKKGIAVDQEKLAELRKNFRLSIPNPIATLIVLADLESALILFATGMSMALFYAISAGASQNFREVYGYDELHISLMFLPIGGGGIIAAFSTGKLVDW